MQNFSQAPSGIPMVGAYQSTTTVSCYLVLELHVGKSPRHFHSETFSVRRYFCSYSRISSSNYNQYGFLTPYVWLGLERARKILVQPGSFYASQLGNCHLAPSCRHQGFNRFGLNFGPILQNLPFRTGQVLQDFKKRVGVK